MPDMLASLLTLPNSGPLYEALLAEGIEIIRPLAPDKQRLLAWIEQNSYAAAASECDVCFSRLPVSCFIALKGSQICGYACYNAIAPGFFGPTMVLQSQRGKGLGKALLLRALEALREEGYVYAIIGGVGPEAFYQKCVGAFTIPGSSPGIYKNCIALRDKKEK